jgi:hypothetical protein
MYLLGPSELSRAARGKQVLVRQTNDGKVVIECKGAALPARAFAKDARVAQAAIADNKVLGPLLADIQQRQHERDATTLATKRLTLREEELVRKGMREAGQPARRAPGRPTIRELALARLGAEARTSGSVVDQLVAQTVKRLADSQPPEPRAEVESCPRTTQSVPAAAMRPATHSHRA